MSEDNVALIRSVYAAAGTEITALFRDDAIFEQIRGLFEPLVTDDFVCSIVMPGADRSEGRTYEGTGGLRSVWLDWLEPWESHSAAEQRFVDLGDRVLMLGRNRSGY